MSWRELEERRSRLNHDLVKNEFANMVGNVRTDLTLHERSEHINIAWTSMRGEQAVVKVAHIRIPRGHDSIEWVKESVRHGLDNWAGVENAVRSFFDRAPQECGCRTTPLFQAVYKAIFTGRNAKIRVISRFVRDFDALAHAPEEMRNKRLKTFWDAVGYIYSKLHEMRPGMDDDARFGEYFES